MEVGRIEAGVTSQSSFTFFTKKIPRATYDVRPVFFLKFCQTIADRKVLHQPTLDHQTLAFSVPEKIKLVLIHVRGERERLFGSREREGKLKITFPFYGKGTIIRKCYGKGRELEI